MYTDYNIAGDRFNRTECHNSQINNPYLHKPPEWIISILKAFATPNNLTNKYDEFDCIDTMINDGACDDACQTDECLNDINDCNLECIDDYCSLIYRYWGYLIGNNDQIYAANYSVVCNQWVPKMQQYIELSKIAMIGIFRS